MRTKIKILFVILLILGITIGVHAVAIHKVECSQRDYTIADDQVHTAAPGSPTINRTYFEPTRVVIPKEEQKRLFREYQSTRQLLCHNQTLNTQLAALFMAAIFLLLGLSISNVSKSNKESFGLYFPFVMPMSIAAFVIWAVWFIYMLGVQELLIAHEVELEQKLGFSIETRVKAEFDKKVMPPLPESRGYWPIWLALGFTIILTGLYFGVMKNTHLFFWCVFGLTIAVAVGFPLDYSGVGVLVGVGIGLLVPISFVLRKKYLVVFRYVRQFWNTKRLMRHK